MGFGFLKSFNGVLLALLLLALFIVGAIYFLFPNQSSRFLSDIRPGIVSVSQRDPFTHEYIIQGYFLGATKERDGLKEVVVLSMEKEESSLKTPFTIVIPESMGTKAKGTKPDSLIGKSYKRLKLRLVYKTYGEQLKQSFTINDLMEWDILVFFHN